MPRGSVEILSGFGASEAREIGSAPMRIRILQSRWRPGHVNILMNPKNDERWIDIVEAYDVDVRDLLLALKTTGVLKSYEVRRLPKKYKLTLFGLDIFVADGRRQDWKTHAAFRKQKQEESWKACSQANP